MIDITERQAKELMLQYGTLMWFTVQFIKKNGEERTMNCRLGVTRHLKGGELKYDPSEKDLLIAWCRKRRDYRAINLKTVSRLKINKQEYNVQHA